MLETRTTTTRVEAAEVATTRLVVKEESSGLPPQPRNHLTINAEARAVAVTHPEAVQQVPIKTPILPTQEDSKITTTVNTTAGEVVKSSKNLVIRVLHITKTAE
jgi:hypothetical protein